LIDAGMALGNQYSVVIIDIDGKISFGSRYLGLGFTYANYSETVADIPGISGNIDKGGKFGVDIFGGIPLDKQLNLQAGINTAIGFTGSLLYSF
jgi:hypothetical protein